MQMVEDAVFENPSATGSVVDDTISSGHKDIVQQNMHVFNILTKNNMCDYC